MFLRCLAAHKRCSLVHAMKKYLWSVHLTAGVLALFESSFIVQEFLRMGMLLAIFSVAALIGLIAIYVAERLAEKK